MIRFPSKRLAAVVLCLIFCSMPSWVGGEELQFRLPILRYNCSKPHILNNVPPWNFCSAIWRAGFVCDEVLYFERLISMDDMVAGLQEYAVACAFKHLCTTEPEKPGTRCVFVRSFWVGLMDLDQSEVRQDDQISSEILSAVKAALSDRKLEPCDNKELFESAIRTSPQSGG